MHKCISCIEARRRADIRALALNKDNTNLLVSTLDKQSIIFTDPIAGRLSRILMRREQANGRQEDLVGY
ncbi:hypothetical protein AAZX31_08G267400 [Glycine max]